MLLLRRWSAGLSSGPKSGDNLFRGSQRGTDCEALQGRGCTGDRVPGRALPFPGTRYRWIYQHFQSATGGHRRGLSEAGDFYIRKVSEQAFRYAIADCAVNTRIIAACLGNKAGSLGAASLFLN